ncbi:hypothetical protein [Microbulbifer thermotolerans]|uniref:Uncharacterized protein n=1 Tax=Microbulbifer thermotolerans TaxID=252514 RepID=A0A143HMU3_MICTH|nr:hypothetical protein [Microbulbifer thermotolerans]AMX03013.1 hypothetical protein A3224_10930 [Microbulbifer thermotolerans]
MELDEFEKSIVSAIGKHQPLILDVIDELKVKSREYTGPGLFVNFMPIKGKVDCGIQVLDLLGQIELQSGLVLSAHIEMSEGKPDFLEVYTLPLTEWDGTYSGFAICN